MDDRSSNSLEPLAGITCEDRLYKFKNRYAIYTVRPRPSSKKLAFVFSGVDATPGTCRMSYFALGETLDATVVHIMDNFGAHGCYLLSIAGDAQIRNAVIALIRLLQEEFACTEKQTYFLGTSKGATTAIAYALMTGGGNVLCGEPQILLGDFIFSERWQELEQWRSLAYAMTGRVSPADRPLLNRVVLDIVERYGSRFKGEITIHVGDTGYLEKHISHLQSLSSELGFDKKIHIESHAFTKHDEVVPVFLDTVANTLNTHMSAEARTL
ncbi:MAG: hypothetical protein CAF45_008100 [Nitrospira sp. CG24E]|nr:MAG: hypothetical protein CAF45_008100 [Nitrospira sp. CG24E]